MRPGLRGIVMHLERLLVGADGEHEARAESMRRAQEIAEIDDFEMPSTPMAK